VSEPVVDPAEFTLSRTSRGACEIVSLAGELDLAHAATVADTLEELTAETSVVVVDLTDLTFIDSSGIHAILAPRPGQEAVVLVCPPGNVRRVFDLTRLDRVVPFYESLDEALAALG
jgi:anti-sigma B factor antagonist